MTNASRSGRGMLPDLIKAISWAGAAFAACAVSSVQVQAAASTGLQTQTYVVSWFGQATATTDDDCSQGVHPEVEQLFLRYAKALGVSQSQINAWHRGFLEGEDNRDLMQLMGMRGRINGEPVNPYTHPASVVDLKLPGLDGPMAYGFDLDGSGADQSSGFTDPQTGEKGVDHQLYRAFGCVRAFRGSLEGRPTYWAWSWGQLKESQPAWVVTVQGADLNADGPVTVRLERAIEYLRSNSDGTPRRDAAYRVDPDPRSRNEFDGVIRDGVVHVASQETLRLLQSPLVAPELELDKFHLRLHRQADGSVKAFMGGYQPWHDLYWAFGSVGIGGEQQVTGDIIALYYLLKRYADADPDPQTGQNRRISATYYIEAVPAFVQQPQEAAQMVGR